MKPDPRFLKQPSNFWAHVRSISQAVGYTTEGTGYIPVPKGLPIPKNFKKHGGPRKSTVKIIDLPLIRNALRGLDLSDAHVADSLNVATPFGQLLCEYFEYRAKVLNNEVRRNLMDADESAALFKKCKAKYKASGPFVKNKQTGKKKAEAFLTCMVRMIIEDGLGGSKCNFDPLKLTTITRNGEPFRTLARRVDGAYPSPVNPIAIWEIKEYYYTTTFGSRIADGVYETLLDGMEIEEFRADLDDDIKHYLFTDSHFTWWGCGKSYLCRIVDMLHMGFVDEVLFGKEIITELPRIVNEWRSADQSRAAKQASSTSK
ncbi:MAG: hypothetical protein IT427_11515 [Pirellulales bacterium]|nr:hypothetical protein [Pirellulales bacterium]